jgi:hypothetical protein
MVRPARAHLISSPEHRLGCSHHLLSLSVVRMIWWFLILGVSTLVVVCVAIALYMRLRRHLRKAHAAHDGTLSAVERERQTDRIEH